MDFEFLQYGYFDSLPSELILLILYQIDDFDEITSLIESSGIIKFVYLDNVARVKRNVILRGIPEIKDVLDDEYTLQEIKNLSNGEIERLILLIRTDLKVINPSREHWRGIDSSGYKIYNLICRYRISIMVPIIYQKIKDLKFDKTIDISDIIYDDLDYYKAPHWARLYTLLKNELRNLSEPFTLIFKLGMPKNYVINIAELDEDLYNEELTYALTKDPNFNLEIQFDEVLLTIIFKLYQLDIDIYRDFVRRISQDKKLKLAERIKKAYQEMQIEEPGLNYSQLYNDMLKDFIRRL